MPAVMVGRHSRAAGKRDDFFKFMGKPFTEDADTKHPCGPFCPTACSLAPPPPTISVFPCHYCIAVSLKSPFVCVSPWLSLYLTIPFHFSCSPSFLPFIPSLSMSPANLPWPPQVSCSPTLFLPSSPIAALPHPIFSVFHADIPKWLVKEMHF